MPNKSNTPAPAPAPVCTVCGKSLKRGKSVNAGMGHTCATLQTNPLFATPAATQAHYAKHTAPAIPAGYIKLATFKQIVPANKHKIAGLNINKVVKCIGRDRAKNAPAHAICKPVYVNNVRYVHGWLGTQAGLTAIATGNFSNAPATKAGK